MSWMELLNSEQFRLLYEEGGQAFERIRSIERVVFEHATTDLAELAAMKGERLGILKVYEMVNNLAMEEAEHKISASEGRELEKRRDLLAASGLPRRIARLQRPSPDTIRTASGRRNG